MVPEYTLYIPSSIERRLGRLGAVAQQAIRTALRHTVHGASKSRFGTVRERLFPPLRLYANEYRVLYQIERDTRRVVVLSLDKAFA